ncbi:hypothetical protein [Paracraurococcus ruber]|uniref:Thioesterase family protein n=1 Tax=Paracraurococcus ruber TaxID=77675 RepID=A0ABS1CY67_9PROT|nr:hypothetical protein [Paracraurococcus ruber]MBK1659474.1 hypothetical protein [Paracraurococcus ruber]TDG33478.1 hypothetical protein E2C05_03790 [Paracraurococcus ruber]
MTEVVVEGRFRGPAGIGNGGYVAGRMAALLGARPAEVTLRRGWPLDVPLRVARDAETLQARDAEGMVIAEAREAALDLAPPVPPTPEAAAAATRWFLASPFTHSTGWCFVCGSAWEEGVGLRVLTGRVEGRPDIAAGLWRPHAAFADGDGVVRPEFLWAALDCAGAFAFTVNDRPQRMLLGRITARLDGAVRAGEPVVALGWQIGREGRKLQAGTALFGADGGLRGIARALWVLPAPVAG